MSSTTPIIAPATAGGVYVRYEAIDRIHAHTAKERPDAPADDSVDEELARPRRDAESHPRGGADDRPREAAPHDEEKQRTAGQAPRRFGLGCAGHSCAELEDHAGRNAHGEPGEETDDEAYRAAQCRSRPRLRQEAVGGPDEEPDERSGHRKERKPGELVA
jgi:hypothetical protein